jgi:hypothetical protein
MEVVYIHRAYVSQVGAQYVLIRLVSWLFMVGKADEHFRKSLNMSSSSGSNSPLTALLMYKLLTMDEICYILYEEVELRSW